MELWFINDESKKTSLFFSHFLLFSILLINQLQLYIDYFPVIINYILPKLDIRLDFFFNLAKKYT